MIAVLMVCTGNICRSAYAERLLQVRLDAIAPNAFNVRSAGTQALVGQQMDPSAMKLLLANGGTVGDFAAQQLHEGLLRDISIVLAVTEKHREAIVAMSPKMLKRTYLISEFAEVLNDILEDPAVDLPYGDTESAREIRWLRIRELVLLKRHATLQKNQFFPDILDPYQRGENAFEFMAAQLDPMLRSIVQFESVCLSRES